MRCLALAQAATELGQQVAFCSRDLPEALGGILNQSGYELWVLSLDSESDDARETLRRADAYGADWVVLDHYGLGLDWEREFHSSGRSLLVLDDYPNRPHEARALLDQNWLGSRAQYAELCPGAKFLLGPTYALLRQQFRRAAVRARGAEVRRVLVAFGGADTTNQSSKAIEALRDLKLERIEVVVGALCPYQDEIRALCQQLPEAQFHSQVDDIAQLMSDVDLCLGSPGSTTWERCCLGLPALVLVQAENQWPVAAAGCQLGVHRSLGWDHQVSVAALRQAFLELCHEGQELQRMSRNAQAAVDGLGAVRVAQFLLENSGK